MSGWYILVLSLVLKCIMFVLNVNHGGCIVFHICVFVSSTRPRGAPPEWGVLGSCEPYRPPGLLWWRKTCCWDDVLRLHETGKSQISSWISVVDFFHTALEVFWHRGLSTRKFEFRNVPSYYFSSLLHILCCHFLIPATYHKRRRVVWEPIIIGGRSK